MTTYLLAWNPVRFEWSDLAEAAETVRREGSCEDSWSCGRVKRIRAGDRFFLIRLGLEPRGIVASGYALTAPEPDVIDWDASRKGQVTNYIKVRYDALVGPDMDGILPLAALDQGALAEVHWSTQQSGITIKDEAAELLEELWAEHVGGQAQLPLPRVTARANEPDSAARDACADPVARSACIEMYGSVCAVCGFDFERNYGEWGGGYIEVHNVAPLASRAKDYEVDQARDLIPLCGNCHAMAHHRGEVLGVRLLQAKVAGSGMWNPDRRRYEAPDRPSACPSCGHSPVAEIRHRLMAPSAQLEGELREGTAVLGGCEISGDDPRWTCAACSTQIYKQAQE